MRRDGPGDDRSPDDRGGVDLQDQSYQYFTRVDERWRHHSKAHAPMRVNWTDCDGVVSDEAAPEIRRARRRARSVCSSPSISTSPRMKCASAKLGQPGRFPLRTWGGMKCSSNLTSSSASINPL